VAVTQGLKPRVRFYRRGGRKRIVVPDGSAMVPATRPQPDGTLVKALARAWRWQNLLDNSVYTSVSESAALRTSRRAM
jgi:hypothetical protein